MPVAIYPLKIFLVSDSPASLSRNFESWDKEQRIQIFVDGGQ